MSKKVVIVGGGAGGLELATTLGNKLGKKAEVILVDKNPSHLWKPLLHEIATGTLDSDMEEVHYVAQAKRNHFSFQQGALLDIDREQKQIQIEAVYNTNGEMLFPQRQISYDVLVMAIGSQCNDFGTPGVKAHCVFLDDHIQADRFRQDLDARLSRFASGLERPASGKLNIAIVGGGATGVELAAELFKMLDRLQAYGYQGLSTDILNVTLIEATDRILPALPEKLANSIHQALERLGVKVMTKTMITQASEQGFQPKEGDLIPADIMVWAAGVKAPDFLKDIAGLETSRGNQLVTTETLQTTRDPAIFAIGDCSANPNPQGGVTPPTAQAAHQMAGVCARNVVAYINDLPLKKFKYMDKGTIISISTTAQGVVSTVPGVKNPSLVIKGKLAYITHRLIYRIHQAALYGIIKTVRFVMASRVMRMLRPNLKLD